jgi:IS30 family transposase
MGRHRSTIWREVRRNAHVSEQRRKRYGSHDSRGRLPGKRMIQQRPRHIELRRQPGHWEIDTVL